ncbi:response regulator [Polyangium jinanense]|uniref:Response regulator n=2 Tax=Polyangium jinanense TaxID=2829994 RepID=A0A9X3WZX5_9BACT|nr:response regulator [Polyangium jinanense]MDC3955036.1 response regulator [Polyangium jinanense]MDC3981194.1 response regulator [Polyangium jinanense]
MGTIEQGSRGVLIVEDDPDIRETIAQILEEEGYEVRGASNGKQALDLLREGARPQLILLDLMMPILDGWGFRAEQRSDPRIADIPVIVISADGNLRQQATKIAANGYLRKPVGIETLLSTVARYLKP